MDRELARWWRAQTLTERARAHGPEGDREPSAASGAGQRSPERYERWRSQFPFDDPALFSERLAADQIDEAAFLRVMRDAETAANLEIRGSSGNPANLGPVPAWARTVGAIYRSWERPTPGLSDLAASPAHPTLPFLPCVKPIVDHVMTRLRGAARDMVRAGAVAAFDPRTVPDLLAGGLLGELQRMIAPTMILRLNVARLRGQLDGDTPSERFQSFVSQLGDRAYVTESLADYPVLARMLMRRAEAWLDSSVSFLRHLACDWHDLASAFSPGADLGPLAGVRTQLGDSHRGGRSVLAARFESGRWIVYKPRSLRLDVHFRELLEWVNERVDGPRFRTLTVLDREDRGWVEHADHASCHSADGVRRFFERQGGYLALVYLLDGTDCHCENVLASGEHPVIVDVETLFHPRFDGHAHDVGDPAPEAEDLRRSVLRVGLLPGSMRHGDGPEKLDRGGLASQARQMTSFGLPQPEGAGTDELRLVRKKAPIRPSSHLPVLNGQDVCQVDGDAVIRGFENVYRCLLSHRDELLSHDGPLARFEGDETRVVLRHTLTYSRLLAESFHPDVMLDALDRDLLFDMLWAEVPHAPWLGRVISAEQADLWNGDVPIFTTRVGSRDIFTSAGRRIEGFADERGDVSVRRRVEALGEPDLEKQLWFIRSSLLTLDSDRVRVGRRAGGRAQERAVQEDGGCDRARLIRQARAIGDRLAALAATAGGHAGWNGLTLAAKNDWVLRPTGPDLYDGKAGIVLFLAYLAAVTEEERYHDLALAGATSLSDLILRAGDPRRQVGPFNGRGDLVYLFAHLAALWDSDRYADLAHRLVQELLPYIDQDVTYDVISGAAGCIGGLLALHQAAPSDALLPAAVRCGEHLLRSARQTAGGLGWPSALSDVPLAGFSHGAAGIAWALVTLSRATGETRFKETALAALGYERGLFDTARRNWADLRVTDGVRRSPDAMLSAWCHGAAGVGLSRVAMLPDLDDGTVRAEITHAVETTLATGFGDNHSLCHGDLGNLDFILQAGEVLGNDSWRRRAREQLGRSLSDVERNGWRCGVANSAEIPGLMTGLAGIGYGMLRLAEAQRVPSVLLLSSPLMDGPPPADIPRETGELTVSGGAPR